MKNKRLFGHRQDPSKMDFVDFLAEILRTPNSQKLTYRRLVKYAAKSQERMRLKLDDIAAPIYETAKKSAASNTTVTADTPATADTTIAASKPVTASTPIAADISGSAALPTDANIPDSTDTRNAINMADNTDVSTAADSLDTADTAKALSAPVIPIKAHTSRRRKLLKRMAPVAAAILILTLGSVSMPCSGTFIVRLSLTSSNNGGTYIVQSDSCIVDANSSNMIFEEISDQLGCPQIYLNAYADNIICVQKTIIPETQFAIITLSVNDIPIHLEYKTIGADSSTPLPTSLHKIESIVLSEELSFTIYQNKAEGQEDYFIAYLICDDYVITIRSESDYDSFLLFLKNLTILP